MADAIDLGISGIGPATLLDRGGSAYVYLAEQEEFGRKVAVKVLFDALEDDATYKRFDRECRAIGAVSHHPNIVVVHGRGLTKHERPYLVMEYRAGGSLANQLVVRGRMTEAEAISIGTKIGGALQVAHEAGVLHRDVKPANILLSGYNEPALADFGIARMDGTHKTTEGVFSASVVHASREILDSGTPTPRSDIYALASTMFELVTGNPAYADPDDGSIWAVINRVLGQDPPDPRSFGVSEGLSTVLAKAMRHEPDDRQASAAEFVAELRVLNTPEGIQSETLTMTAATVSPVSRDGSDQPGSDRFGAKPGESSALALTTAAAPDAAPRADADAAADRSTGVAARRPPDGAAGVDPAGTASTERATTDSGDAGRKATRAGRRADNAATASKARRASTEVIDRASLPAEPTGALPNDKKLSRAGLAIAVGVIAVGSLAIGLISIAGQGLPGGADSSAAPTSVLRASTTGTEATSLQAVPRSISNDTEDNNGPEPTSSEDDQNQDPESGNSGATDRTGQEATGQTKPIDTSFTPELRFPRAQIGPLQDDDRYVLAVEGVPGEAEYRIVVDGRPVTRRDSRPPVFFPESGRHQLQVEVATDGRVELTEVVEIYVSGRPPTSGYRVNLSAIRSRPENWPEALRQFDQLVLDGHKGLEISLSDRNEGSTLPFWNFYIYYGQDRDGALVYCQDRDLSNEECYTAELE